MRELNLCDLHHLRDEVIPKMDKLSEEAIDTLIDLVYDLMEKRIKWNKFARMCKPFGVHGNDVRWYVLVELSDEPTAKRIEKIEKELDMLWGM